MRPIRALRLTAVLLATALGGAAASAGTPALVVDVDSGRVLYAENATDPWYPASVTKLMTAYVALKAIREGRASPDTILTMSEEAAAMPPSKMGFRPGTEITLDNALKIIMVKSANDVSQAIAEGLGGTVEGFASLMNQEAARLGMKESRFVNPHGLPDDRQQTSARDMAILGRALLLEFPEHRSLFNIGAIQFGKRVMRNHNGLIGRYAGADGMKTGFICASGFNVVASATRGNRRLITVVMGSPNGNERTQKAASLFERGFMSLGLTGERLEHLPPSASLAPPNMRPVICERRGPTPKEEEENPSVVAETTGGNSDNPSASVFAPSALAFAGTGTVALPKPVLGPRGPVQPTLVWTGRTPPSALASTAATDPAPKPAASRPAAAKPAAKPAPKKAAIAPVPMPAPAPDIIAGDKPAPKGAINAKPAAASPAKKLGAIEAKPKADEKPAPKAAAKPAPKPAAKPAPKPAAKPTPKPAASAEPKKADAKQAAKADAKR